MSDRKAVFILMILCTGVLFLIFGEVIRQPNAYLFGTMGDSIKNYFTFAWYVKYDSGLHFSGMNHPWGEHIVYTDNQPLFSVPLGFIHRHIIPLDQYIIGIINSIVFASMVAGSVVLYFILRKCLLPAWFAIIGAILIMLLSPQHFVISHQYALANLLVLPVVWLVLIRLLEEPRKLGRHIAFVLVSVASGLVHPYYLPMGFLLFFGYWLGYGWLQKSFRKKGVIAYFLLLVTGLLPILLFRSFLWLTESITDRPETPGGFLEGKATVAGLFYPVNSVASAILSSISGKPVLPEPNHGYLGIATLICLAVGTIGWILSLLKNSRAKGVFPAVPGFLKMGLVAGLLIAVFAAAIPFRFGLMHWLDYIPLLKQFRVLSRFTWMFYFIFSVTGIYISYRVYNFLKIKQKTALAYGWLSVICLLWLADAFTMIEVEAEIINRNKLGAEFRGQETPVETFLKKSKGGFASFQVILPIPYYSDGSEKIGHSNWKGTMYQSMKAAYQTGIPISTASLARTSLAQVLLRTQLLSSDSIQKEMLPLLHPTKPLLVMVTDSAEKEYEKQLVGKSKFLARHKNVSYYELPISRLQQVYTEANAAEKVTKLPANVVYETFAKNQSENWLFNKGALVSAEGRTVMFEATLPQAETDRNYQASVWLNARTMTGTPKIWLEEVAAEDSMVQKVAYDLRDATEIYQDWLRTTFYFKLNSATNRVRITMEGTNLVADELLIRPVSQPVYNFSDDQEKVVRNNYLLP